MVVPIVLCNAVLEVRVINPGYFLGYHASELELADEDSISVIAGFADRYRCSRKGPFQVLSPAGSDDQGVGLVPVLNRGNKGVV